MAERRLDHDREVALEQLPPRIRPAFLALWNLDLAFADVVSTSSDPRVGAIRMAWWREQLDALDRGGKPPAEPRLLAVAAELLPRGVTGHELTQLEDAWLPMLETSPLGEAAANGLKQRGEMLFGIGARLLGGEANQAAGAGALWSLVDGAQHCSEPASRNYLISEAKVVLAGIDNRLPRTVRPLTVIAALAAAGLVREGAGLRRLSAAVRHRLLGSLPRS